MNEEELFCKLFPEYVVNGKPLSPYFDLFESGYEQTENRIAELECECRRCIHTDCPCVLSDYGKDRNGICDHFKDVFDENIELKEELKKWKDEWQEQVQKATDEGYARTLQTIQLTKAIEIIKKYYNYNPSCEYFYEDIDKEAEQFLKDSEVEK